MKQASRLCLWIVICLGFNGCAQSTLHDQFWVSPRPLGKIYEAYRPLSDHNSVEHETADSAVVEPTGELLLRDALVAALLGHPRIRTLAYSVRIAEARALQAGQWSNPIVEAKFENFGGSGDTSGTSALETTISLSQTIPLGDDIVRRRRLAQLHGELAGWDYEAARIDVLTQVAQRFVEVLVAQHQVELAQESAELAQQVCNSINRRVDAGDAPAVERSRAVVPVVTAKIDLHDAHRALEAARLKLALTWGSATPRFTRVVGDLHRIEPLPPAWALVTLVNQNPQVARWVVQITARQVEAELFEAKAVPDLTAAIGYRHLNDPDDDVLVAGVSVPLPVFDRRQGDILAARLGVAAAHEQRRLAQLRVQVALAGAYARLTSAHSKAVTLRDEALPPATKAYEAIWRAFNQGNLGFPDVLDAEQTLIEFRRQYLRALAAYHGAVAQIEGLIGQPLDAVKIHAASKSDTHTDQEAKDDKR